MKKEVIIALDFPKKEEVFSFISQFQEETSLFLKIGMELFYAEGSDIIRELKTKKHKIFLDLKLHDIPNTVKKTMKILAEFQVDLVNLHAAGTRAMMEAALTGLTRPDGTRHTRLIAVTQLTSTNETQLREELLIPKNMEETVISYAKNAAAAGLDGVVCSPLEAAKVKHHCGSSFLTVTPGIRFAGAATDDQSRIATPETAASLGCDALVVGRPITASPDPVAAYQACVRSFLE